MPEIRILKQKLDDHIDAEEKRFDTIDNTVNGISNAVIKIRDNHLAHIQKDITTLQTDGKWMKSKVDRIDARTWWILAVMVIGFLSTLAVGVVIIILRSLNI